jgi:hypothetical protein
VAEDMEQITVSAFLQGFVLMGTAVGMLVAGTV